MADENAENAEATEEGQTEDKPKKSKKGLLIVIVLVVVLAAGGGAAALLLGGDSNKQAAATTTDPDASDGEKSDGDGKGAEEAAPVEDAAMPSAAVSYFTMKPPFIVNFSGSDGQSNFLQITVALMVYDDDTIDQIRLHEPYIRNNLVALFSSQADTDFTTAEAKEALRADALKTVQKVMQQQTGTPGVEAVLFTNFVMQ